MSRQIPAQGAAGAVRAGRHRAADAAARERRTHDVAPTPTDTAPPTVTTAGIGRRRALGLFAASGLGSLALLAESGSTAGAAPQAAPVATLDPAPGVTITVDRSSGFVVADIRQSFS